MINEAKEFLNNLDRVKEIISEIYVSKELPEKLDILDFLETFHENVYLYKKISKELYSNESHELDVVLTKTNIEERISNIAVLVRNHLNSSISSRKVDPSFTNKLYDISVSLVSFIGIVKTIYKNYEEIQLDNILFDDSKIDKTQLLEHLNMSLQTFERSEAIDEKEKRKVIIYHKEIIKEVEKPKPLWSKVYGMLGALGLAVSLYIGVPQVIDELNQATKEVEKGMAIEGDIPKIQRMQKMKHIIDLDLKDSKQIENFSTA